MSDKETENSQQEFDLGVAVAKKSRYTATTWIQNNHSACEQLLDLFFNHNYSRRTIAKTLGISRETVAAVIDTFRRRPNDDAAAFFVNSLPLAQKLKQLINPLDDYIDEKIRQSLESESLTLTDAIELREKIMPCNSTNNQKPTSSEVPNDIIDYEEFVNGLVGEEKSGTEVNRNEE